MSVEYNYVDATGYGNLERKKLKLAHLGKANFSAQPIHRYWRKNTFLLHKSFWSVSREWRRFHNYIHDMHWKSLVWMRHARRGIIICYIIIWCATIWCKYCYGTPWDKRSVLRRQCRNTDKLKYKKGCCTADTDCKF